MTLDANSVHDACKMIIHFVLCSRIMLAHRQWPRRHRLEGQRENGRLARGRGDGEKIHESALRRFCMMYLLSTHAHSRDAHEKHTRTPATSGTAWSRPNPRTQSFLGSTFSNAPNLFAFFPFILRPLHVTQSEELMFECLSVFLRLRLPHCSLFAEIGIHTDATFASCCWIYIFVFGTRWSFAC